MKGLRLLKKRIGYSNWVQLQEAFRLLFIFMLLWLALYQVAQARAEVLDQSHHTRIILFEDWRGAYIISHYSEYTGHIRLEYCGTDDTRGCNLIGPEIPIADFPYYEAAVLEVFRRMRDEVAEAADGSMWRFLLGGSDRNSDVAAFDEVIREIEERGLPSLVLLSTENMRQLSPSISSPDMADELVERLAIAFSSEIERPPAPEDSIDSGPQGPSIANLRDLVNGAVRPVTATVR